MNRYAPLFLLIPVCFFFPFTALHAQVPTISCLPVDTGDSTLNDPYSWSRSPWGNAQYPDNDLPEKALSLAVKTSALCPTPDVQVHYELLLDSDGDGQQETLIHSDSLNLPNLIYFGNAAKNACLIQDNMKNCKPAPALTICIKNTRGEIMDDADVDVETGQPAGHNFPISWDGSGCWTVPNGTFISPAYTFTPVSYGNVLNGVTTLDINLIRDYILNKIAFGPYRKIAADVNHSGTITLSDAVEIRRLILGIDETFSRSPSWRFVLQPYNPSNGDPFVAPFRESARITDADSMRQILFIGVKTGDVNGTAQRGTALDDRSLAPLPFAIPDRSVSGGEVFEVTFESRWPLTGQQFTVEYPGLTLLDIVPATPDMTLENFARFADRQMLTHVWNSAAEDATSTRFMLRFRAETAGLLSDKLHLSDRITAALAYQGNDDESAMRPALQFTDRTPSPDVVLHSVRPNPWTTAGDVVFVLPEAGEVRLRLLDASGRVLLEKSGLFDAGMQTFSLSGDALPAGLLHYQLLTSKGRVAGKMIKLN
jgi:hypothetical protein